MMVLNRGFALAFSLPLAALGCGSEGPRVDVTSEAVEGDDDVPSGRLLFRRRPIGDPRCEFPAQTTQGECVVAEIWTMNADGSHARQVTVNSRDDQAAAWSPDGRTILFYSAMPAQIQNLYRIEANEECGPGTFLRLGRFANWTAVKQQIVFDHGQAGARNIFTTKFLKDGSLQDAVNITNTTGTRNTQPAWSPDGKKIVFTRSPPGLTDLFTDIFVMDDDGSHVDQLTDDILQNNAASWSPDGRKIAFHSARDGSGETHIYIWNVDTRTVTQVTNENNRPGKNDLQPEWSPNGKQIVFQGDTGETVDYIDKLGAPRTAGIEQLFIINADGTVSSRSRSEMPLVS
ncbi:MAG TPA: hypothetical protein VM686_20260 [Polyangiaceae bacterium]|nr:hypothetical protein [Polyangiaceae bacterium]